jgi:hypothetical protein
MLPKYRRGKESELFVTKKSLKDYAGEFAVIGNKLLLSWLVNHAEM